MQGKILTERSSAWTQGLPAEGKPVGRTATKMQIRNEKFLLVGIAVISIHILADF